MQVEQLQSCEHVPAGALVKEVQVDALEIQVHMLLLLQSHVEQLYYVVFVQIYLVDKCI